MKYKIIYLLFISLILVACSNNKQDDYNYFGGKERNNFYQNSDYIKYSTQEYFEIDSEDSLSGFSFPLLMLNRNNSVGVLKTGKIIFFKKYIINNQIKLADNLYVVSKPAADKKLNIYFISSNNTINSYSETGKKLWSKSLPFSSDDLTYSDVFTSMGSIIFGNSNGELYNYSLNGELNWKKKFSKSIGSIISANNDGNFAVSLNSRTYDSIDSLVIISLKGKVIWAKGFNFQKISNSAVYSDGFYYIGTYSLDYNTENGSLSKIDAKGKVIWTKSLPVKPRWISIDNDKNIFVSGYNPATEENISGVFSLNSNGDFRWKMYFKSTIHSPVLTARGNLVVCGADKNGTSLYVMDKTSGKVEKMISLNDYAQFHLYPSVTEDNSLIMSGINKTVILRLSDEYLKKFNLF